MNSQMGNGMKGTGSPEKTYPKIGEETLIKRDADHYEMG